MLGTVRSGPAFEKRIQISSSLFSGEFDRMGLEVTEKLLSANADVTSFWNYRRKALETLLTAAQSTDTERELKPKSVSYQAPGVFL